VSFCISVHTQKWNHSKRGHERILEALNSAGHDGNNIETLLTCFYTLKFKAITVVLPVHCIIKISDFGPVRFSYNPSFSACFFSWNSVFLSQQIRRNNVSACFSAKRMGPMYGA